jgi:hypothetical protein
MAHATLELEINASPRIALQVLTVAKNKHPEVLRNCSFVRLFAQVLVQLGDVQQLRWLLQSALDDLRKETSVEDTSSILVTTDKQIRNKQTSQATNETKLQKELELLDEFLRSEIILSRGGVEHLNQLRDRRLHVKTQLDEINRSKLGGFVSARDESRPGKREIFDAASELLERYDIFSFQKLPETDLDLSERCRGRSSFDPLSLRLDKQKADSSDVKNLNSDFYLSLSSLPGILRTFVTQLPPLIGAHPDFDGFIRHMKSVVLPPRPEPIDIGLESISAQNEVVLAMENDDEVAAVDGNAHNDVFRKRIRFA